MRLALITRFSHFEAEGQTPPWQACLSSSTEPLHVSTSNPAAPLPLLSGCQTLLVGCLPHGFKDKCNQAQEMLRALRVEAQQEENLSLTWPGRRLWPPCTRTSRRRWGSRAAGSLGWTRQASQPPPSLSPLSWSLQEGYRMSGGPRDMEGIRP